MIHMLRIFGNKAFKVLRRSLAGIGGSSRGAVTGVAGIARVMHTPQGTLSDDSGSRAGLGAVENGDLLPVESYGKSVLAGELHRLAMRWRASGRWPAQTTAHMSRLLGQDVCLPGLERVLWQMGRHSPPLGAESSASRGPLGLDVLDLIRVRLRQEQAAQKWLEAFFRAQFPDLTQAQLSETGLLNCLDDRAIDPGAFASSTYLPGDSRELPADEVMLDGTSIFDEDPEETAQGIVFERVDSLWQTNALKGLARQVLARIRRDTERSMHDYGRASSALLRIGPVIRAMGALEVETDSLYRHRSRGFLSTAQGERLVVALPLTRNLPDVIAARVDDLSNASSRIHALQWAARSTDPFATRLAQAGQSSVLLGIRRSTWDATCRLLLFPDAVIAGMGAGAQTQASMAGHDVDSGFDMSLTIDQQRQRTHTFALDQVSHENQDQLHGAIAGYAMSRLTPIMRPGSAAALTQRWCRAWADLMTVCGPR